MKQSRLGELARAFGGLAAYALTGVTWLAFFRHFVTVMAPRVQNFWHHGPVQNTPPCFSPDCDFSVFWPAGLMARAGDLAGLYQPARFLVFRHDVLFAGAQRLDWFYPPPSLLPVMAVSYMPFQVAFFAWTLLFILAAILLLRWAGLPWAVVGLGLLSPASLLVVEMGQFDIAWGAAAVAGLLMAEVAPARAGALLGLLLIKPQTAVLAPLAVVLRRNWCATGAGVAMVAGLLLAVTLVLGWRVWPAYELSLQVVSKQFITFNSMLGLNGGVSILWMMRSFGAGAALAYTAQGVGALLGLWVVWLAYQAPLGAEERMALIVFASLWVLPNGYTDDMVAYSIALAALAWQRGWRINLLDGLLFFWPALCPVVVDITGILLTPVAVGLALLRCWGQAGRLLPAAASVLPGSA
jgi:alpha-1,2-mannosyltransferase